MKEERVGWRDREREGCRKGGREREVWREGEGGSDEEKSETESDADTPLLLDERVVMARRRLS